MRKILSIIFVGMFFIGVGKVYCQVILPYEIGSDMITGGGGSASSPEYKLFSFTGFPSALTFSESAGYLNYDDLFSAHPSLPPIYPRVGTIGTEMTILGSGFGIKKGKVLLEKIVDEIPKPVSLKVISWDDDSIRVQLSKFPSLGPGVYSVIIRPVGKGVLPVVLENGFTVSLPGQLDMEGENYPNAVWTIGGKFFGTKKPQVNLETQKEIYDEDEMKLVKVKVKVKSCSVKTYKMHPTTGEGEVVFWMPSKTVPEYEMIGVYPSGFKPDYYIAKDQSDCPYYCDCRNTTYQCPNRCVADLTLCPAHCDRNIYCQCNPECGGS